jgi:hypothetical protein
VGVVATINETSFPKQGAYLGKDVRVCFNYGTATFGGKILRDDVEEPFQTLILIHDGPHAGRIIRSTECQYQIAPGPEGPTETIGDVAFRYA